MAVSLSRCVLKEEWQDQVSRGCGMATTPMELGRVGWGGGVCVCVPGRRLTPFNKHDERTAEATNTRTPHFLTVLT